MDGWMGGCLLDDRFEQRKEADDGALGVLRVGYAELPIRRGLIRLDRDSCRK